MLGNDRQVVGWIQAARLASSNDDRELDEELEVTTQAAAERFDGVNNSGRGDGFPSP
jgi:hypothetical protein